MKKNYFSILFACTLLGVAFVSCTKNSIPPKQETIVGKWVIQSALGDYTVQGTNWKDTTYFSDADYIQFNADSTVDILETSNAYSGKWVITNDKLVITQTSYIDYPNGFDIKQLTKTNLQLYYVTADGNGSTKQTLNLKK
jgi:hypothetical protein